MSEAQLTTLGVALGSIWMVVGSVALAAWLRARVLRGPQPWTVLDGGLGLAVLAWVSTWTSIGAVRLTLGHWLPQVGEEMPLVPVVVATGLAGFAAAAFALARAGAGGLGLRRVTPSWMLAGTAMVAPMVLVSALWVALLQALGMTFEEQQLLTRLRDGWGDVGAWVVVGYGVVGAPLVEEILFRGFLLPPLARFAGRWPAILLAALLFGVLHGGDPQAVPPLILLGVALGWLRLRSDSLVPSLLMHIGNNAVAIFALAVQTAAS